MTTDLQKYFWQQSVIVKLQLAGHRNPLECGSLRTKIMYGVLHVEWTSFQNYDSLE